MEKGKGMESTRKSKYWVNIRKMNNDCRNIYFSWDSNICTNEMYGNNNIKDKRAKCK